MSKNLIVFLINTPRCSVIFRKRAKFVARCSVIRNAFDPKGTGVYVKNSFTCAEPAPGL